MEKFHVYKSEAILDTRPQVPYPVRTRSWKCIFDQSRPVLAKIWPRSGMSQPHHAFAFLQFDILSSNSSVAIHHEGKIRDTQGKLCSPDGTVLYPHQDVIANLYVLLYCMYVLFKYEFCITNEVSRRWVLYSFFFFFLEFECKWKTEFKRYEHFILITKALRNERLHSLKNRGSFYFIY